MTFPDPLHRNIMTNDLQLGDLYRRSALSASFERVEVEAFSRGSIIVDYYVVFRQLERPVDTQDLKDAVERGTARSDRTNMLGALQIDPRHSDFIGIRNIFSCTRPRSVIFFIFTFFSLISVYGSNTNMQNS